MSSRPLLAPQSVITNGDMTTTLTSLPTVIQNVSMPSYALSWTSSSISGKAAIQVSNDFSTGSPNKAANAGTWTTVPLSVNGSTVQYVTINTDNSTAFIDLALLSAYAVRLVYSPTSGTGTLQAVISGKSS